METRFLKVLVVNTAKRAGVGKGRRLVLSNLKIRLSEKLFRIYARLC